MYMQNSCKIRHLRYCTRFQIVKLTSLKTHPEMYPKKSIFLMNKIPFFGKSLPNVVLAVSASKVHNTCHSQNPRSSRFHYRLLPPLESFWAFQSFPIIARLSKKPFWRGVFWVKSLCGDPF